MVGQWMTAEFCENLPAIDIGHHDIQEDGLRIVVFDHCKYIGRLARNDYLITGPRSIALDQAQEILVIVDYQYFN